MAALPLRVATGSRRGSRFHNVLTLDSLITLVQGVARQPNLWRPGVHFGTRSRHTTRLHRDDQVEMWVTSWLPGSPPEQRDGAPHNHGDSIGVFTVVEGELIEERIDRDGQLLVSRLTPSVIRPLAPHLAHDVRNTSELPAISIHAATVAASARAACVVPVLSWPRRAELSRPHARTA